MEQRPLSCPISPEYVDVPQQIARARRSRKWPLGALCALLVLDALFLARNFAPAIFAPDDHAYFKQAALLARTHQPFIELASPVQFLGPHWMKLPNGSYTSHYAFGYPALLAIAMTAAGPNGAMMVNPCLALLAAVLFYRLVRLQLGHWWALAGAALLTANSAITARAFIRDAHLLVLVLLLAALTEFYHWLEVPRGRRLAAAGCFAGCCAAVRPPEALYSLGFVAGILAAERIARHKRSDILVWCAGALVPLAPVMWFNLRTFGAPWATAYGITGEADAFSLGHLISHADIYIGNMLRNEGLGLFFLLGMAGMIGMAIQRRTRAWAICCLLVTQASLALYMAYYWAPPSPATFTLRFITPTFPIYLLAGLWFLNYVSLRLTKRPWRAFIAALILWRYIGGSIVSLSRAPEYEYQQTVLARAAQLLGANVPDRSVVLANPKFLQHLDVLQRWRLADPTLSVQIPQLPQMEQHWREQGAEPFQPERRRQRTARYFPRNSVPRADLFMNDVRAWAGQSPIYFIGTAAELLLIQSLYPLPGAPRIIARAPAPAFPNPRFAALNRLGHRQPTAHADKPMAAVDQLENLLEGRTNVRDHSAGPAVAGLALLRDPLRGARELIIAELVPGTPAARGTKK